MARDKKKQQPERWRRDRMFSPEDVEEMALMYERGYSTREIAFIMECSHYTAARYLRENNVDMRRSQTDTATAARMSRFRERMFSKAESLLDRSDDLEHRMITPYETIVSGPEGTEVVTLSEPPLREQADAARAISNLATTAGELFEISTAEVTNNDGGDVIDRIFNGLQDLFHGEDADAGLGPQDFEGDGYDIRTDPNEVPGGELFDDEDEEDEE